MRDLKVGDDIVVVTWLHRARRNRLLARPRGEAGVPVQGVFSTRSPARPNPIGLHATTVAAVEGTRISVSSLEAIDGTPILDIKPTLEPRGRP
jgi:tRNA-Thr(GGU) m(6)t(6)A37 methyltransferase TsaA